MKKNALASRRKRKKKNFHLADLLKSNAAFDLNVNK